VSSTPTRISVDSIELCATARTARPWNPTRLQLVPPFVVWYRPSVVAAHSLVAAVGLMNSCRTSARADSPLALAVQLVPPSVVL